MAGKKISDVAVALGKARENVVKQLQKMEGNSDGIYSDAFKKLQGKLASIDQGLEELKMDNERVLEKRSGGNTYADGGDPKKVKYTGPREMNLITYDPNSDDHGQYLTDFEHKKSIMKDKGDYTISKEVYKHPKSGEKIIMKDVTGPDYHEYTQKSNKGNFLRNYYHNMNPETGQPEAYYSGIEPGYYMDYPDNPFEQQEIRPLFKESATPDYYMDYRAYGGSLKQYQTGGEIDKNKLPLWHPSHPLNKEYKQMFPDAKALQQFNKGQRKSARKGYIEEAKSPSEYFMYKRNNPHEFEKIDYVAPSLSTPDSIGPNPTFPSFPDTLENPYDIPEPASPQYKMSQYTMDNAGQALTIGQITDRAWEDNKLKWRQGTPKKWKSKSDMQTDKKYKGPQITDSYGRAYRPSDYKKAYGGKLPKYLNGGDPITNEFGDFDFDANFGAVDQAVMSGGYDLGGTGYGDFLKNEYGYTGPAGQGGGMNPYLMGAAGLGSLANIGYNIHMGRQDITPYTQNYMDETGMRDYMGKFEETNKMVPYKTDAQQRAIDANYKATQDMSRQFGDTAAQRMANIYAGGDQRNKAMRGLYEQAFNIDAAARQREAQGYAHLAGMEGQMAQARAAEDKYKFLYDQQAQAMKDAYTGQAFQDINKLGMTGMMAASSSGRNALLEQMAKEMYS
jgi:hypothetical protein